MTQAGDDLRVAIVMHKAGVSRDAAEKALAENDCVIESTLKSV
jgi:N-acetylmuramic acid 6-phosphate (MurNAc-6-P) etherase